jgi:Cd2+/Zn2+-exporting ATPase
MRIETMSAPALNSASPQSLSWKVEGMDCAGCAAIIRGAVERLPGVTDTRLSVMSEMLTLTAAAGVANPKQIEKVVRSLGYGVKRVEGRPVAAATTAPAHVHGPGCAHDHSHDHADGHRPAEGDDHGDHKRVAAQSTAMSADSGPSQPDHAHEAIPSGTRWFETAKGRLVLVSGALLAGAWAAKSIIGDGPAYWAFIAACVIGVVPVVRRALAAARAGMPFTIEMLMTIAAAGALVIGAAEEAALVVFLFAVGEVLEGVAADRARASIRALGELVPKTAVIEENGQTRTVAAATLAVGQTILVRPGDRIPADGTVIGGTSGVDEAPVTGESVPRTKSVGDAVFAGSINTEAALRIRVDKAAQDNTISRIIRLVEETQEARAPTERFIDRFSRIYMPVIVGLALVIMLVPPLLFGGEWATWIYRSLALLLIGCPCALVISVPAAIASSLAAGAKRGLLMKGGAVIEAAAATRVVAFDKTGTLTIGKPTVTDVVASGVEKAELLVLAAGVEAGSSHPLAQAVLAETTRVGVAPKPATGARAIIGKGVEATIDGVAVFVGSLRLATEVAFLSEDIRTEAEKLEGAGKTVAAVFRAGHVIGLLAMRDEPREDAVRAVTELKALGVSAVMLTGDNTRTAAAIAGSLGMDYRAELMPDEKVTEIKRLAGDGGIMMIGDGINDAPALAAATIGVAMGSGTDVALETADAALLRNRVTDAPRLVRLARATMSNIRVNIAIALGLKAAFLVTSILGLTGLWIAILADTGATVLVTLNALRLLRFNPDAPNQRHES